MPSKRLNPNRKKQSKIPLTDKKRTEIHELLRDSDFTFSEIAHRKRCHVSDVSEVDKAGGGIRYRLKTPESSTEPKVKNYPKRVIAPTKFKGNFL